MLSALPARGARLGADGGLPPYREPAREADGHAATQADGTPSLEAALAAHLASAGSLATPAAAAPLTPEAREALRALGYLE
jgi:hypothetical protein